ncbi:glycosyl transferase, partial [Mycobacterium sp. ITM-2017-0098]
VPNVMDLDAVRFSAEARTRVRTEHGIPTDAFTVGCVSRFHPKTRLDVLVRAAAQLGPDAHLLLAGDGETEDELKALSHQLLGDRA